MTTLTRGQLARATGVGRETIRFYENKGLLPPPPRSAAGYRCFGESTVQRLHFIRRAKTLGFTLPEIADLLSLHDNTASDRSAVKAIATRKVAEIESRIRDLSKMHAALSDLATRCSGHGSLDNCPIVQALIVEPTPAE